MKRTLSFIVVLSFCIFSFVAPVFAAPEKSSKKEKELPPSGALASSGQYGRGNAGAGLPWGSVDGGISGGSPISGSIIRSGSGEWQLKVFNNSEDSYSVSLEVIQYSATGSRVKTDNYSYSLAPGKSAERKIPAGIGADRAELNLGNWRKTGSSKKKEAKTEGAGEVAVKGEGATETIE